MRSFDTRHARVRADRRIRLGLRAGVTAVVLGTVAAGAGLTALPAGATVPPVTVRVIGGNHQVTAGWAKVPGVATYTVRLSTSSSMSNPRVVHVTGLSKAFTGLSNGHRYYVRVTPESSTVRAASAQSVVTPATAHSGDPLPIDNANVKVVSDGPNRIKVTWAGGGRATKVAVIAGSDVNMTTRKFSSSWRPATTRTIRLTVPTAYRPVLGAGSGNPVFVKVVQSNLSDPSPAMGLRYSDALDYRLTMPGRYAFAGAATAAAPAGVSRITVGELNVQSVGASAGFHLQDQWAARKTRVAATVTKYAPDLLLTAELATNLAQNADCRNTMLQPYKCQPNAQYETLARLLPDYRLATDDAYRRVLDRMRSNPDWAGHITDGAQILYNPKVLTEVGHGYISPVFTLGLGKQGWTPSIGDRWLSWARLRVNATGTEFYAVAAHFPVGSSSAIVDLRLAEAKATVSYLHGLTGDLPVVFGGDLNADTARAPKAGATEFIKDGFFDAAATTHRAGARYSTSRGSGTQDGADPGYPRTATLMPYVTSRIDYILLKRSPFTYGYQNVLSLTTGQTLDNAYYNGSDHNLQLAQVGIVNPVPPAS